jgi:hypothetical protein
MNFCVEAAPESLTRAGKKFINGRDSRAAYSYSFGVFDGSFSDVNQTKIISLEAGFQSKHPLVSSAKRVLQGLCLITAGSSIVGFTAGSSIVGCSKALGGFQAQGLSTVGLTMCGTGVGLTYLGILDANLFGSSMEAIRIMNAEIRPRDENMANNLIAALNANHKNSIAGTMGAGHLYGVGRALKANGFIDHDLDLIKQYQSFLENEETAQMLNGTQLRSMASLKDRSFLGEAIERQAREIYPEDFSSSDLSGLSWLREQTRN